MPHPTNANALREQGVKAAKQSGRQPNSIILTGSSTEPRIDSRLIAQVLGNKHQNVRELLTDYVDDFRELGILRFQTGEIAGRGQPERYALLNEDQAYLLLTYSRNTAKVRQLKVRLVLAFREARQAQDIHQTEYLPTYHSLHDEIARLADGADKQRYVHMNVNRAINKAVGVKSGERHTLPLPSKAMLIVAQSVAHDHKDGYQAAKVALQDLNHALEVSHV